MRRVLITGMSGTGKSSVVHELSRLGLKAGERLWYSRARARVLFERRPERGSFPKRTASG